MRVFRMIQSFQALVVVAGLILALAGDVKADSTRPYIEGLTIKDRDGTLICSLRLKNGLTDEIRKILSSGITVKYTYVIELLRPGLFLNKRVKEVKKVRYITYDHLKQEYRVLLGPNSQRMISVKSEKEAEKFAFYLNDVEVVRFRSILQGSVYILRVKAIIGQEREAELPFKRLIGLFWKKSIETDWDEIRFRY